MHKIALLMLCLVGLAGRPDAATAQARTIVDCALRDAPFSTSLPVMDILASPAAREVVDRHVPGLMSRLPPDFLSADAPSFSAILRLRDLLGMQRNSPVDIGPIDRDLGRLPVTPADQARRCARYDADRVSVRMPAGRPRILLFEKINGYRDDPSVRAAHAAFIEMARRRGWAIVATDRGGAIRPDVLANVDLVIWNNISGDVLTLTQRQALQRFIEGGGGFLGVHGSGGDPAYFWDWYADTLIGARFIGHPLDPQFQAATIRADAAGAAFGLPASWSMTDEWYSFARSPRTSGASIIATLDETTYTPEGRGGQNLRMGDHPIAWTRCVGRGRMFYSAIGHRPETYSEPIYVGLLEQGIAWAGGSRRPCRAPLTARP